MVVTMRRPPSRTDFDGWVAQLGYGSSRPRAKQHLLDSGRPAVGAICRGLRHEKALVRRQCVNLLDHLVDDDSLHALIAAVDDDDSAVAGRALHALACDRCKEGECRPGEELWVAKALDLLHHADPDRRAAAIDALGKVASRRDDVAAALVSVSERDADRGLRGMARHRAGR